MKLEINETGDNFYRKWYKDSRLGFFVVGPAMLLFFGTCFTMIVGFSIKLIFVLAFPMLLILVGFVHTPLVKRGRCMNRLIKQIAINNGLAEIETYSWFTYEAIVLTADVSDLKVYEIRDDSLFKGKKVFWVEHNKHSSEGLYLIEEFFENVDDVIKVTNG